jgi:hypothetical protein
MIFGLLVCPPAHDVIRVNPMFEQRQDIGKVTCSKTLLRDTTLQAIHVKAAL